MALIREAIRAGANDLTLIPPTTTSIAADLLIAAGCLKKLYLSYVGFEFLGFAPAFRKAAQEGTMEIVEADEPFIQLGTQAAAGGRPFNVVQHMYEATDHPRLNPEIKKTTDPFTGKEVYCIPPGHLFVLGDNRGQSNDSKSGLGLIPVARVKGLVRWTLWPWR